MAGINIGFRYYRYEQKLACLLWKIDIKDVTFIPTTESSTKNSMVTYLILLFFLIYQYFDVIKFEVMESFTDFKRGLHYYKKKKKIV